MKTLFPRNLTFSSYIKRVRKNPIYQKIERPITGAVLDGVARSNGFNDEKEKKKEAMKEKEKVKDLFPLDIKDAEPFKPIGPLNSYTSYMAPEQSGYRQASAPKFVPPAPVEKEEEDKDGILQTKGEGRLPTGIVKIPEPKYPEPVKPSPAMVNYDDELKRLIIKIANNPNAVLNRRENVVYISLGYALRRHVKELKSYWDIEEYNYKKTMISRKGFPWLVANMNNFIPKISYSFSEEMELRLFVDRV